MGPRPKDFDEELVRQAPTFKRWLKLRNGETLKYACREFVKGEDDDEERLMRRIMIARRNNLRDHAILKRARAQIEQPSKKKIKSLDEESVQVPSKKKRGNAFVLTDEEVMREMDVAAVEATRSFRAWLELKDGQTFTYNQTYVKGKEGHEWLLKKNIWRRMRYRRENKKMVEKLKDYGSQSCPTSSSKRVKEIAVKQEEEEYSDYDVDSQSENPYDEEGNDVSISNQSDCHNISIKLNDDVKDEALNEDQHHHQDVVEAAVAAAESYVKQARESDTTDIDVVKSTLVDQEPMQPLSLHNPLIPILNAHVSTKAESLDSSFSDHHLTANPLVGIDEDALDVAAKLAAAASANMCYESGDDDYAAV